MLVADFYTVNINRIPWQVGRQSWFILVHIIKDKRIFTILQNLYFLDMANGYNLILLFDEY